MTVIRFWSVESKPYEIHQWEVNPQTLDEAIQVMALAFAVQAPALANKPIFRLEVQDDKGTRVLVGEKEKWWQRIKRRLFRRR
jgi:hypothetical protein